MNNVDNAQYFRNLLKSIVELRYNFQKCGMNSPLEIILDGPTFRKFKILAVIAGILEDGACTTFMISGIVFKEVSS